MTHIFCVSYVVAVEATRRGVPRAHARDVHRLYHVPVGSRS